MTLAVAFLAGLVSCISPCVLPVLPVFAGYIVGGSGEARLASAPIGRAVGFLVGFLGVFVLLWASLGLVGFALLQTVPLARGLAGVLIVVLGLAMMAGYHPTISMPVGNRLSGGAPVLLGAGVAVGWTPCIGPTLGAILTLAAAAPDGRSGDATPRCLRARTGRTVPVRTGCLHPVPPPVRVVRRAPSRRRDRVGDPGHRRGRPRLRWAVRAPRRTLHLRGHVVRRLLVASLAAVGAWRLRPRFGRLLRTIHRCSGLFAPHGAALDARVAPRIRLDRSA